ncbi:MAG: hypothetical protein WD025_01745 [Bacteriovoracaceae bacterium]
MTYHESKKLKQLRVRVGKAYSSFVYFTLEANEGLAFYSTLEESSDDQHRDLLVLSTPEYYDQLLEELRHLQKRAPLEILSDQLIEDAAL